MIISSEQRQKMNAMKYTLILTLFTLLLVNPAPAQGILTDNLVGRVYVKIVPCANCDTLYFDVDTLHLGQALRRIIDSLVSQDSGIAVKPPLEIVSQGRIKLIQLNGDTAIAYRGGAAVDTTKFVSMNRDDAAIRGEKTFLGMVGFKLFGQFDLTSGQRRAFWASADTATKRVGDTVVTVSATGTGEQLFQVYSSGIIDLSKQSAVRAYRNGNVSLTGGLTVNVDFNAETFDTQYEFNSATPYNFVARTAGKYEVCATITVDGSAAMYCDVFIYKGVAAVSWGKSETSRPSYVCVIQVHDVLTLSAGDTVSISVSPESNCTLLGTTDQTYVTIRKVM